MCEKVKSSCGTVSTCARLKLAEQSYLNGYSCAQAVFSAFAEELGLDAETAYRLMEGFGNSFGGKREVCDAFSAAVAVISHYYSSGNMDGKSNGRTDQAVWRAAEIFEKEYGSIRCREIHHGNVPKAFQCGMKVKDAVLVVGQILADRETTVRQTTEETKG